MTHGSDPWSADWNGEDQRAGAVLEMAFAEGLVDKASLQKAAASAGIKIEDAAADRLLELAVETGLLTPTQAVSLGRDAAASAPTNVAVDPFDRPPVENWDRYELTEFIGRGGMGDVYQARDPRLGRLVAVKFLRRDDPEVVARFVREARIQARVDHEGVCPVYEVGEVQGRPFIVMQYVAGGALPEVRDRLSLKEKVQIIADVAAALHAAHRLGLVHRDVKPANIMVELTESGAWRPFVVDFGIAREIDSRGLTQTGAVLGTPAFSAPEQLAGKSDLIDARSDIYGLGATLYWVLTGRPPYEGSYTEIMAGHTSAVPTPPSQLNSEISRDLETVMLTCLEIDQDRRYPSAFAAGEDLRRFLAGEPIEAQRASVFYRMSKTARRHPAVSTAIVATLVTVMAIGGFSLHDRWQTARRATIAQALLERVSGIESFMRVVAMMPQHDTTAERELVHRRMDELRHEADALGGVARGPGLYALGRAHLVLGEVEQAVADLREAWDSGYRGQSVASAFGRALGAVYEKELRNARHIADAELRRSVESRIAVTYRDRALELLRTSVITDMEAPAFTEALIAYYEGRLADALESTQLAASQAPWHFQTLRLQGDIGLAVAADLASEGKVGIALVELSRAGDAYDQALEIARSDAASHTALCHRWLQEMEVLERDGRSSDVAFASAEAACAAARSVAPREAAPWETTALLLWRRGDSLNDRGEDPMPVLDRAAIAAAKAIEINPESGNGHHALGGSQTVVALNLASHGLDPEAALAQAVKNLGRAVELEPGNPEIADDLGYAFDRRARYHLGLGRDPRSDLDLALKNYQRALELSPDYANAHNNSGIAHWRRGVWEMRSGLDCDASFRSAEHSFRSALELNSRYAYAWANLGMCKRTQGLVALGQGKDPGEILGEARHALLQALAINPSIAYAHIEVAAAEIVAARAALERGTSPVRHLETASSAAQRAISTNPASSAVWQTSAEVHRYRAAALSRRSRSPDREIEIGLREVNKALDLNPRSWQALLTRATLYLEKAHQQDGSARLVQKALDDVQAAVASNPLAEHEAGSLRSAAQSLLK